MNTRMSSYERDRCPKEYRSGGWVSPMVAESGSEENTDGSTRTSIGRRDTIFRRRHRMRCLIRDHTRTSRDKAQRDISQQHQGKILGTMVVCTELAGTFLCSSALHMNDPNTNEHAEEQSSPPEAVSIHWSPLWNS